MKVYLPNCSTNLKDLLKEKYNLKLAGLIRFLTDNEEVLDYLNTIIPNSGDYRFLNKMNDDDK